MPKTDLTRRPKFDRLAAGKGVAPPKEGESPVDREGGEFKAGLISGVAVITRGPALGHGMWIDATTVEQTAALINAAPKGVKSRFTHPSLSGDGMGKHLGRAKDATIDGDVARADLHLFDAAHRGPDGDLAAHVMDLAEEDPEAFGNSIAFEHDIEAENAFVEEHGGEVINAKYGLYDLTNFESPDPDNTENTFHVRLKELRAVDVVDEPAANPSGLFHRGQQIPAEADALCEYAFGLSDTRPASAALGIDPDRLRGYASRFLSSRGLTVAQFGDGGMQKPGSKLNATPASDGEPTAGADAGTETGAGDTGESGASEGSSKTGTEKTTDGESAGEAGGTSQATNEGGDPQLSAFRSQLAQFIALDPVEGPKWLSEGKTFAEAQALTIEKLRAEKSTLGTKLASVNRGEAAPVSFSSTDGGTDQQTPPPRLTGLTDGQARFASAIRLPGRG